VHGFPEPIPPHVVHGTIGSWISDAPKVYEAIAKVLGNDPMKLIPVHRPRVKEGDAKRA
jgi:hypothetical protein